MKRNLLKNLSLTFALTLTLAFILSLAGCNNTDLTDDSTPATESTAPDTTDVSSSDATDEPASSDTTEDPEPEKLDLNQDLVSDIGLTFEEMKEKHGEVVDYQVLNGGSHYKFENGYGFYFFYGDPPVSVGYGSGNEEWVYNDDGTPWYPIPRKECVCIGIDNLKAKDIFSLEFEELYEHEIKSIYGVTLFESSANKMYIFDSNTLTIKYSGFPTGTTSLSIKYYDAITPESPATLGIHPLHWESFISGNLPEFNDDLLSDIGLTFEELKDK